MNSKQFVIVIVITFFVGMVWLITDIIFNTKASVPVSPKQQTLLESVNPNFNEQILEKISKETLDKKLIPDSEATAALPSPTPTPAPSLSPTPSPQPSVEDTSSLPEGSQSAQPTL